MRGLIILPGVPLTFLLCVILRTCGVERPGLLFFVMMSGMMGVLITFITLFTMVCLWPNIGSIAAVLLAYLFNATLGKLLLGGN